MVFKSTWGSMKLFVLFALCMQNTLFTVLRRYSQGVLREVYSKVSHHTCAQIERYNIYAYHHMSYVVNYYVFIFTQQTPPNIQ